MCVDVQDLVDEGSVFFFFFFLKQQFASCREGEYKLPVP